MLRMLLTAALPSILALQPAWAYCFDPSFSGNEPTGPWSRPDVPFCLNGYGFTGQHNCDDWQIRSYQDDIERHVRDLETYRDEAVEFANEAIAYANAVSAYAECEAGEVVSQHE